MSNSVFDNSQIDNNKHSNSVNQIYEQEKALYLSKLKRHTSNLRKNQIISIILFFIDLWICYMYPYVFQTLFNIAVIFVYFIWTLISICLFRKNYETTDDIEESSYKKVVFALYITLSNIIVIAINLLILICTKVIFNFNGFSSYLNFRSNESKVKLFLIIVVLLIYAVFNIIVPYYTVKQFRKIKKALKGVGNLKGQEYSVTYTVELPDLGLNNKSRKVEIK